jgi:26S proteasome regulatory subunit N8
LRGLHTRLAEIGTYLESVRDGKMPINHQVIYQLQEVIGLLPQLGGDVDLGKAFRAGVNDQSIIVYLSSIIRTVLALHDLSECLQPKILNIVDPIVENRISNAQQELEDAKSPESKEHDKAAEAAGVTPAEVEKAKREKEQDEKDKGGKK